MPTIVDDNTVSNMVSKIILPEEGALEQLDHDEIRQEIYQDIKTRLLVDISIWPAIKKQT